MPARPVRRRRWRWDCGWRAPTNSPASTAEPNWASAPMLCGQVSRAFCRAQRTRCRHDALDGAPARHAGFAAGDLALEDDSNVWYGFGHGHMGLTWGPSTGRLISELMTGPRAISIFRRSGWTASSGQIFSNACAAPEEHGGHPDHSWLPLSRMLAVALGHLARSAIVSATCLAAGKSSSPLAPATHSERASSAARTFPRSSKIVLSQKGFDGAGHRLRRQRADDGQELERLEASVPPNSAVVIVQPGGNDKRKGVEHKRAANIADSATPQAQGIAVIMMANPVSAAIRAGRRAAFEPAVS